jgi:archaellum component FlaD/FlaE
MNYSEKLKPYGIHNDVIELLEQEVTSLERWISESVGGSSDVINSRDASRLVVSEASKQRSIVDRNFSNAKSYDEFIRETAYDLKRNSFERDLSKNLDEALDKLAKEVDKAEAEEIYHREDREDEETAEVYGEKVKFLLDIIEKLEYLQKN